MQPEKAVIFGPIIIFFLVFASLAIGFLVVVIKLVLKGKKAAWRGTLVDKIHNSRRDDDSKRMNHYYSLVFKNEEGKEIKIGVAKETFDEYNLGDKAEKKSGELWPKKIS